MSTYSTQLFAGYVPGALAVVYTVPSGSVVVVRDIELVDLSSAPLCKWFGGSPGALWAFIATQLPTAPGHFQWQGRVVLSSGQELAALSTSSTTQALVSGYVLGP